MCEWSEVAACSYASFLGDDRDDIIFNMPLDPFQRFHLDATDSLVPTHAFL